MVELADVVADGPPADARVDLHVHEVAERERGLLRLRGELARGREHEGLDLAGVGVEHLAEREGDHGRLAGTGLRLRDDVAAARDWHDRALLNRRGLLESVRVETAEEVLADAHGVEGGHHLDALGRVEGDVLILVEVHARVPHCDPLFSVCVSLSLLVNLPPTALSIGFMRREICAAGGSRGGLRGVRRRGTDDRRSRSCHVRAVRPRVPAGDARGRPKAAPIAAAAGLKNRSADFSRRSLIATPKHVLTTRRTRSHPWPPCRPTYPPR